MKLAPFVPGPFALGLLALGVALLMFPSLRVAGAIAVILGLAYWLLMIVLASKRR